jgi:hypothetical protein
MADKKPVDTKQYFFDKPRNVNLVLYSLYISCGLLVLLDFIIHRHTYHKWEDLLGFYSIYGFLACTAIVLGSKALRNLVERSEDFYEADSDQMTNVSGGDHVVK